MTFLTCTFQEQAVKVGQNDVDDNEYAEASNLLLDAWITVISHAEEFPLDLFKEHGLRIVDTYLKCHFGSPDGIRSEAETSCLDEINHDIVEGDRDAFSDELSNIGYFARMCLLEVFPVLIQKLSVRNGYLKELLNHEKQRQRGTVTGAPSTDVLFEDIHWLILISTYILTIDATGESDQVPGEIIECSNKYLTTHLHCVSQSVKYLMSVGKDGDMNNVDPTIALFTTIMQTAELEMEFLQNNLTSSFSPELCSTILWFFKRFARGYLGVSCSQLKASPCLNACFDLSGDCGKFIMKSFLDSAELNLSHWSSEPQVSEDVAQLLLRIFSDKKRVEVTLSMPNVWSIAKKFSTHDVSIISLKPKVQRNLVEGLMKACMEVPDERTKEELKTQVLKPIMDRYQNMRCVENFKNIAQQEESKYKIIQTFECLRGIFPSCFASFSDRLFLYFLPIIKDTINLLPIYDNYANIVNTILEMYVDLMEHILSFLNQENTTLLCKICLEMMESYSKLNLRKKVSQNEEDQFYDVLLLIRLLSHILSKDYLNLGEPDPNGSTQNICPVDVVLYGLQVIIPLISQELLKYPNLSDEYFKLVTFVCEVYPEKINTLPPDLFQNFMTSIQMAISDFGVDTGKCALDALSSLAKYLHNECDRSDVVNGPLVNALQQFLNIIFQHIVLGHFNMELIEPAAESLFLLICCHQEEYLKLANNLIENQHVTDEAFKQRLIDAFQVLTPASLQLTPNRQSMKQFRKNLEVFLQNVKGFLCFK